MGLFLSKTCKHSPVICVLAWPRSVFPTLSNVCQSEYFSVYLSNMYVLWLLNSYSAGQTLSDNEIFCIDQNSSVFV